MVNGKQYQEVGRIGKGGSSDVYRVMAENGKLFALKRVKLEDADESAVRGYKGEIELLRKLEGVERVVRLFDWEVDEEKQILSVVSSLPTLSKTLPENGQNFGLQRLTWVSANGHRRIRPCSHFADEN